MTISKVDATVLPCSGNHGHDGDVFIEIYKAHPAEDEKSRQVWVCPVLESFRSSKSEAFTPQFVGLGPYHHSHPKLPVTDELKFGIIKRVLKVADISGAYKSLQSQDFVSEIESFYHNTCKSDSHTLAHVLTVDGLFLLAFLQIHYDHNFRNSSKHFVLTGKHYAILPVNAAGVELSMDGVIRDLFMLENQVPIYAIKHIIQALDWDSGLSSTEPFSIMLEFCKAHSPFAVIDEKISEPSDGTVHLLQIMYMLVASTWERSTRNVQVGLIDKAIRVVMLVPSLLIGPFCLCLWILLWTVAYVIVVTLHPFLKFIRFILVKVIPWSAAIFGEPKLQFPTLRHFFGAVGDLSLYYVLNSRFFSSSLALFELLLRILSSFIPDTERALDYVFARLELDELDSSATIPSAAKLKECRIRFKGVESNIRAVKFDDRKGELELPCIKLDHTSEVILRNLAAYESCIYNYNGHTKVRIYIEFMGALVQTHEDVRFLVDEKIVQTQLSADAVIQIFKMPAGEPAGSHCQYPVDIEDLHMKLKNVKAKADVINNLYLIFTEFLRICAVCAVVVAFFPLLSEGFHKIWCSTFFATSSGGYCGGNQVGESAGGSDNYNIITST